MVREFLFNEDDGNVAIDDRSMDTREIRRLQRAIEYSREKLRNFREKRLAIMKEYVGFNYSNDGTEDIVPVNFIELAVNILMQSMVADNPRSLATTIHDELKPQALSLKLATNHWIETEQLKEMLLEVAQDAIICLGISKQGLERDGNIDFEGEKIDVTKPFADSVDLDDFVIDMRARKWKEVNFLGDRRRVTKEELINDPLLDQKIIAEILDSSFNFDSEESINKSGDVRSHTISQGTDVKQGHKLEETTDVWDIYLPKKRQIVFLLGTDLREIGRIEWDGPAPGPGPLKMGPYKLLYFNKVNNQLFPLAPAANMKDLHDLGNALFRKLGRQAIRQKTIGVIDGRATDDGKRIQSADDGDIIRSDTGMVTEVNFGGPNAENMAFFLQTSQLYSKFQGNLDLLGGLAPQSETVGQDRILGAAASKRIQAMQVKMIDFTESIVRDISFYLFTDPLIDLPLSERVPGFDISIPVAFSASDRKGEFLDYNITIDVFSMRKESPESKMQSIIGLLNQVFLPLFPFMQQEGFTLDFQELIKIVSSYANLPEIADLLVMTSGEQFDQEENLGPIGKPPTSGGITTKHTIRTNRSGTTERGTANAMIQKLMGANPQQAELAGFGQ